MYPRLRVIGEWMKITEPARIRSKRRRMGYTQANLAALVGCTQQYISLLESGCDTDCSEKVALAICKRLDLDLDDICERREIRAPRDTSSKVATKRIPAAVA